MQPTCTSRLLSEIHLAFSPIVPLAPSHWLSSPTFAPSHVSLNAARNALSYSRATLRVSLSAFPDHSDDGPHPCDHFSVFSPELVKENATDFRKPGGKSISFQETSVKSTAQQISSVISGKSGLSDIQNTNEGGISGDRGSGDWTGDGNQSDNKKHVHDMLKSDSERDRGSLSTNEPQVEELYFSGLSYPIDALDWCSTNSPDFLDGRTGSVNALRPDRMCADDRIISMRVERTFVDTFRMSSPYIHAYQGLIFVIYIPGDIINEPHFASVMEDIALMRVVGIKIVLVLGPHTLVAQRLRDEGIEPHFINGIRVTDARTLRIVKELAGSMRFEIECALAKGVTNMPSRSRISVVSGNFFSAQPVGIIDGKDFGYTGKVRRVDAEAINKRLADDDILLISNVGGSPSGQQFNCKGEELAAECAAALKAEKLIFMGDGETLYDRRSGRIISNMVLKTASRFLLLREKELPSDFQIIMQCSVSALKRGVTRAHILNRRMNGVLLMEVFHRDGIGLMISRDLYEGFRPAKLKDVNGVKEIIQPLEDKGILKRRSHTMLERDIEKFVVIERDGMIIACLSLTIMEDEPTWAELGCVAVHQNYRKLGKGDAMLEFTERMAYGKGVRNLFVLSTQSFDWFLERGFAEVLIDDLPKSRQVLYDRSRRSKIFYKVLQQRNL